MITGGLGGSDLKAAEIYIPATNQSCILPDLPTSRYYHSQAGLRACGGRPSTEYYAHCDKTCDTWNPETGSWAAQDVSLIGCKAENSWTTARGEGSYLIGGYGWYSGNGAEGWENTKTSDLLKPDGTVIPGFNLTYRT